MAIRTTRTRNLKTETEDINSDASATSLVLHNIIKINEKLKHDSESVNIERLKDI